MMVRRQPIGGPAQNRTTGETPPARDPEQAWFWSEHWQQLEREADAEIKAGRLKRFDTVDELFADLESDG